MHSNMSLVDCRSNNNPFRMGAVFARQMLTSEVDPRTERHQQKYNGHRHGYSNEAERDNQHINDDLIYKKIRVLRDKDGKY